MLPVVTLATVLLCGGGAGPRWINASAVASIGRQAQDPEPNPAEQPKPVGTQQRPGPTLATPVTPASPATAGLSTAPTTPVTPAKAADKPKKVITNDDLKSGGGGGSGFSPMEFSEINDCDRNCFEQVRQLARVAPASNPNWKRDLLQAIDQVRKDDEWQKYLRELYDLHLKFCQLGDDKREELNKYADPRNVTPREIAIDDKYDVKFKEVQASLQTLYTRQGDLQRRFGANPFAYQFSNVQTTRIQNARCAQQRYPRYAPSYADDP